MGDQGTWKASVGPRRLKRVAQPHQGVVGGGRASSCHEPGGEAQQDVTRGSATFVATYVWPSPSRDLTLPSISASPAFHPDPCS